MNKYEEISKNLLKRADIDINGNKPSDISVLNNNFYKRVLTQGSLGLGESYMDGWWESEKLEEFIAKILKSDIQKQAMNFRTFMFLAPRVLKTVVSDFGSSAKSHNIGEHHYDVGNDIYRAMLDKAMVYTCGYWRNAHNLDEAQEAKLDLVCKKLGLEPGMKVLDIGCGWGSFLKFAAEKYGVKGVGVTVSKEQAALARELCVGLPVEIRKQDYREIDEKFDRIVSLGMFEHVGIKYYKVFMKKVRELLKDDGLFLLHTIGSHYNRRATDPWIDKYIFPGGVLPSVSNISAAFQPYFVMEDWHNFGYDYYKTLMKWFENFNAAWPELSKKTKYDERFYRMWKYYLLSCAGAFKSRHIQLWQIVLSPNGVEGGYRSIR